MKTKFADLAGMTADELFSRIETLEKELFEARFKLATHQQDDTAFFRRARHEIAQLKTALRQKEAAAPGEKAHA